MNDGLYTDKHVTNAIHKETYLNWQNKENRVISLTSLDKEEGTKSNFTGNSCSKQWRYLKKLLTLKIIEHLPFTNSAKG